MTTIAQAKRVARPLLERNADLAQVGRLIVIKPIHHLIRGVFLGRSSNPLFFQLTWFVNVVFRPGGSTLETWGERLYTKRGTLRAPYNPRAIRARARILSEQLRLPLRERRYPRSWGGWNVADPTITSEMCKVIEQQALPMLRGVQSIDDFVAFTSDRTRFPWTYLGSNYFDEPFIYTAHGNFEAALRTCTRLSTEYPASIHLKEFVELIANGDRGSLARLLHEFEADTIKRGRFEEYWEPTPFPIEL